MPKRKNAKPNGRHIQARLLEDRLSENPAVIELDYLRGTGLNDREIIRNALIAHRTMRTEGGWSAPDVVDEFTVTASMLDILNKMKDVLSMFASADLTSARNSASWNEDVFQEANDLLSASADVFFGNGKVYNDDE